MTLRATGCNLVPAGVCGVLRDATSARNLLSQGPSHDEEDGVRNRETGRQASGRQIDALRHGIGISGYVIARRLTLCFDIPVPKVIGTLGFD